MINYEEKLIPPDKTISRKSKKKKKKDFQKYSTQRVYWYHFRYQLNEEKLIPPADEIRKKRAKKLWSRW